MSAVSEMAAAMIAEADLLLPQKLELEQRRLQLNVLLHDVHEEQRRLGQRYSDLHTAAQALERVS